MNDHESSGLKGNHSKTYTLITVVANPFRGEPGCQGYYTVTRELVQRDCDITYRSDLEMVSNENGGSRHAQMLTKNVTIFKMLNATKTL